MLKMSQVEIIKDLQTEGLGPVANVERLNISRKTVIKHIAEDGFQEKPKAEKEELPSNSSR